MRGGADTDEKMGHEQDASPNPRAVCYNFQLSAHCQVCRHQLLRMCGAVAGTAGSEGEPGVSGIKDKPQLVHKAHSRPRSYKAEPSLLMPVIIHQSFRNIGQGSEMLSCCWKAEVCNYLQSYEH